MSRRLTIAILFGLLGCKPEYPPQVAEALAQHYRAVGGRHGNVVCWVDQFGAKIYAPDLTRDEIGWCNVNFEDRTGIKP